MAASESTLPLQQRLRACGSDRSYVFFVTLILLHLIPLWAFRYFPSLDGPVHLSIATVLREYHSPAWPIFRAYYVLNTDPDPNLKSGHIL